MLKADNRSRRSCLLKSTDRLPTVRRWNGLQVSPLHQEPFGRKLAGGGMNALVGHLAQPTSHRDVGAFAVDREPLLGQAAGQGNIEAAAQIADEALHLALGLGPVRLTQPGRKAAMAGKIEKAGMEAVLPAPVAVALGNNRAHIVVEDLTRNPAKSQKGVLVGGNQRLDPLVADKLNISRPTPTERRHEHRKPIGTAPDHRPVRLHLFARRGLEADDRRRSRHRLEGGDKHLQHRVAAGITPLAQLTQEDAGRDPVRRCRSQASGNIALERVELGYPLRPRLVAHRLLVTKIAPHRVARHPKLAGDLAYALPMPMQNPDLQCHLCSHHPGPLSNEETLYRVGQTSIGDWVSFAPALTGCTAALLRALPRAIKMRSSTADIRQRQLLGGRSFVI